MSSLPADDSERRDPSLAGPRVRVLEQLARRGERLLRVEPREREHDLADDQRRRTRRPSLATSAGAASFAWRRPVGLDEQRGEILVRVLRGLESAGPIDGSPVRDQDLGEPAAQRRAVALPLIAAITTPGCSAARAARREMVSRTTVVSSPRPDCRIGIDRCSMSLNAAACDVIRDAAQSRIVSRSASGGERRARPGRGGRGHADEDDATRTRDLHHEPSQRAAGSAPPAASTSAG